jgi:hypothetical protein
MKQQTMAGVFALALMAAHSAAQADVVTTGKVIRGVTLAGPAGPSGTSTGQNCDFAGEEVSQAGKMTGASVNCQAGGNTPQVLAGLPVRFNAYCAINAPVKSARLITASRSDNANHCDLSGITIQDATGQFKGAVWR